MISSFETDRIARITRGIANPDMRARALDARIDAQIECVVDEWGDAPEWGELRQGLRIGLSYGGSTSASSISIERSPTGEAIHLTEEEALQVIRCLAAAVDALRELDGQRYACDVGECSHPVHRLRRNPPHLEVVR